MLALAKSLLEFTVLVILATVGRVMCRMSAPMLLALGTVLCHLVNFLGNRFIG